MIKKPLVLFIEANIGGGKTSILDKLNKLGYKNIKLIYEPVNYWIKSGLLDKFYKDKKRWSYTFQNFAFITKIMALSNLDPNFTYIVERSPFVDKYCFAKMCYDQNLMDETEWTIYNYWFDYLIKTLDINYKFIHLKVDTNICLDRIKNRNRDSEDTISIKYLELIDDYTNKWLSTESNVITINGNLDINDNTNINIILSHI